MADIEKFGRTFSFDDDVSTEQQERRIRNWMQKNAPDELKTETPAQQEKPIVQSGTNDDKPAPKGDSKALRLLSSVLLGPMGPLAQTIPASGKPWAT